MQLPENDPVARELGALVLEALARNSTFFSAALPRASIRRCSTATAAGSRSATTSTTPSATTAAARRRAVRTDLSATLFLSAPDEYDGGELVIEDTYGTQRVKLPAGDLVLYPGTSLHHVTPVTRGERVASFFWIQSLVRDDASAACCSTWTWRSGA